MCVMACWQHLEVPVQCRYAASTMIGAFKGHVSVAVIFEINAHN